jgi:NAD(P)H dehydrogenase (quinone)
VNSTSPVAVTGAAGKTGRAVLRALSGRGVPVRALVRDTGQEAPVRLTGTPEVRVVDLDGPAEPLCAALEGVSAVYHIPPNMHPREDVLTAGVIAAAGSGGVERFVLHSVLAPYLPSMPHHLRKARSEEIVRLSGMRWTILQPASYMQNTFGVLTLGRGRGVVRVPYSVEAPFSPVDLLDVAEAAVRVLVQDGHEHASYELAGPESLSTKDMAEVLSEAGVGDIRAEAQPLAAWRADAVAAGMPAQTVDDLAAMFGHYDTHGLVGGSRILAHLIGRAPTTFQELVLREWPAAQGVP